MEYLLNCEWLSYVHAQPVRPNMVNVHNFDLLNTRSLFVGLTINRISRRIRNFKLVPNSVLTRIAFWCLKSHSECHNGWIYLITVFWRVCARARTEQTERRKTQSNISLTDVYFLVRSLLFQRETFTGKKTHISTDEKSSCHQQKKSTPKYMLSSSHVVYF